jgi:hypothetical protein
VRYCSVTIYSNLHICPDALSDPAPVPASRARDQGHRYLQRRPLGGLSLCGCGLRRKPRSDANLLSIIMDRRLRLGQPPYGNGRGESMLKCSQHMACTKLLRVGRAMATRGHRGLLR